MITTQLSKQMLEAALEPYFLAQQYSKDTRRAYLGDIACFLQFLREHGRRRRITEVSSADVADYLAYLEARGGKAKSLSLLTIGRRLAALSSYFHYLVRTGQCPNNPVTSVNRLHLNRPAPRQPITTQAVEQLLSAPVGDGFRASRDRAVLELLYSCGITASQLTGLNVTDVDLAREVILIRHGRGQRPIPIGPYALGVVRAYLKVRRQMPHHRSPGDEPLFINRFGSRLSRRGIGKVFERYRKVAGVPLANPSTIRRTFARNLWDRGASLPVIQELMGHLQLSTIRHVVDFTDR